MARDLENKEQEKNNMSGNRISKRDQADMLLELYFQASGQPAWKIRAMRNIADAGRSQPCGIKPEETSLNNAIAILQRRLVEGGYSVRPLNPGGDSGPWGFVGKIEATSSPGPPAS